MIKIVHARRARSARVIWLLEELGVSYELETVDFHPDALQSPEHLARHPLGQIPVVFDGDVKLIESGAMVQYFLEKHGQGRLEPAVGAPERGAYLQWFHYGEATLARHTGDIVRHRFGLPESIRVPAVADAARPRLHAALGVVDRELEGRTFILGDAFSAADIMVSYGIIMAKIAGELPAEFANLALYMGRLKERPAYKKAWA
jgi:glutathione S-transferase